MSLLGWRSFCWLVETDAHIGQLARIAITVTVLESGLDAHTSKKRGRGGVSIKNLLFNPLTDSDEHPRRHKQPAGAASSMPYEAMPTKLPEKKRLKELADI